MTFVSIQNITRALENPILVKYCSSFLCRLRGLTFHKPLSQEEGLLLVQSEDNRFNSTIHMLGVGFDLTVVWINKQDTVVDKTIARSWHPVYIPRLPARYILECAESRINDFQVGDCVKIGALDEATAQR